MKSEEWKSYRTRFLVNAKQLNSTLSFVDHLGRQHRGRKGDYLVESSDGVISIAPRRIFEDIYVPMSQPQGSADAETVGGIERMIGTTTNRATMRFEPEIDLQKFEALEIEEIWPGKPSLGPHRMNATQVVGQDQATAVQRKLPQSCRDRRSPGSLLGLM
jgi:hypothetical protein